MATDTIHNPRTGQRMRFLESTAEVLRIETTNAPGRDGEPRHVHPRQESRVRVVSGHMEHELDGTVHRLGPGATLVVPAGVPHRFAAAGDQDVVAIQEFRPGLGLERFFRAWFAMAQRGELNADGMPPLRRLARVAPQFGEEIRVVRPPWPVQRAVFALVRAATADPT